MTRLPNIYTIYWYNYRYFLSRLLVLDMVASTRFIATCWGAGAYKKTSELQCNKKTHIRPDIGNRRSPAKGKGWIFFAWLLSKRFCDDVFPGPIHPCLPATTARQTALEQSKDHVQCFCHTAIHAVKNRFGWYRLYTHRRVVRRSFQTASAVWRERRSDQ